LAGLIDEIIERELKEVSGWLAGWLELARCGDIEIKLTSFESLHADAASFFEDILDFFAPKAPRAIPLPDALAERKAAHAGPALSNYRRGSTDEWRSALTVGQARAIAAAGPAFHGLYTDLAG
jgi:hypothetical protein